MPSWYVHNYFTFIITIVIVVITATVTTSLAVAITINTNATTVVAGTVVFVIEFNIEGLYLLFTTNMVGSSIF